MKPQDRENILYKTGKRVQINEEEKILIKKFEELYTNKKIKALDVGCGSGEIMEILNNYGCITMGIDFSSEAINICKKKNLDAKQADLDSGINIDDNFFDMVWAGDVIEHVFDPLFLIKELSRIIKTNGYIFFSIPNDLHFSKRIITLMGESYQYSYYKKFGIYKHHSFFSLNLLNYFFKKNKLEILDLNRIIRIPKINRKFILKGSFFDLFAMAYFGVAKKND